MLFRADCAERKSYVEVLGVNLVVLWLVEVLLGHGHTLLEKVLVDLLAVLLWNQPGALSVSFHMRWNMRVREAYMLAVLLECSFGDCRGRGFRREVAEVHKLRIG